MSGGRQPVMDAASWGRLQAREPAVLEAFCRQWLPVVLQWCRRLGGHRVDPDAACQDVFLVLLDHLEDIHGPEVVSGYIFGVVRRVLAQHRRGSFARRWASGTPPEARTSPADRPDRRAAAGAAVVAIQQILDGLPPELVEVWVLCEVEERSVPEVVEITGVVEGTLRTRLRKARRLVRHRAVRRGILEGVADAGK